MPYKAIILMGLMQSALFTYLPLLIEKTRFTITSWSWIISGSTFAFVFLSPVWGQLIQRYGAKRTLAWSFSGFVVSQLLLTISIDDTVIALIPAYGIAALLLLSRIIYSLFTSGLYASAQAEALQQSTTNIRKKLARLSASNQGGRLLGPALVALCMPFHPMMALYILCLAGIVIVIFFIIRRSQTVPTDPDQFVHCTKDNPPEKSSYHVLKALPELAMATCLMLFTGLIQFSLGPYLQYLWHLSATEASQISGIYFSISAFTLILTSLILVPAIHRYNAGYTIIMLLCLSAGSILLALANHNVILMSGIILFSVGAGLMPPYYGNHLRQQWPSQQGTISGHLTSAQTLGYSIGTLTGGLLMHHYPSYTFHPLIIAGPSLVILNYYRHKKLSR